MLERVLEPEVMDTAEEAADYDAIDHAEVNTRFCEDLLAVRGDLPSPMLDVGTGTALIPIEVCKRSAKVEIVGIDLADHMLSLGRENVARAGFAGRIRLERIDAKAMPYADGTFGGVMSNSIIHHIPEPVDAMKELWRVTAKGGLVFLRDLARPATDEDVTRLVDVYGGRPPSDPDEHESFRRQRALLDASLRAALSLDEVRALVAPFGIPNDAVRMTSDRHWTLAYVKP